MMNDHKPKPKYNRSFIQASRSLIESFLIEKGFMAIEISGELVFERVDERNENLRIRVMTSIGIDEEMTSASRKKAIHVLLMWKQREIEDVIVKRMGKQGGIVDRIYDAIYDMHGYSTHLLDQPVCTHCGSPTRENKCIMGSMCRRMVEVKSHQTTINWNEVVDPADAADAAAVTESEENKMGYNHDWKLNTASDEVELNSEGKEKKKYFADMVTGSFHFAMRGGNQVVEAKFQIVDGPVAYWRNFLHTQRAFNLAEGGMLASGWNGDTNDYSTVGSERVVVTVVEDDDGRLTIEYINAVPGKRVGNLENEEAKNYFSSEIVKKREIAKVKAAAPWPPRSRNGGGSR